MTLVTFVILVLATYRLTRLVTLDDLTHGLRVRVDNRFPGIGPWAPGDTPRPRWPVIFVNCPWCVAVWAAALLTVLAWWGNLINGWQLIVLAWLAAAAGAGLISRLEA